MPVPPETVGVSADTAQLLSGGAFAAASREYLRPATIWKQRLLAASLCLGGSYLFGPFVAKLMHAIADIPPTVSGSIAGLACIGVAEGILTAADRLDLTLWSPWRKLP